MQLKDLLTSVDVHVVVRVSPPLGVPTIYGPFPTKELAVEWCVANCQKANAYIGKVYHPEEVKQHTIVIPDGSNIG